MKLTLLRLAIYSLLLQPLYTYPCPDETPSPTWYESIARCMAEYKKSILCLLARVRAGSQPVAQAVYYIRHRKHGSCLTYHAGGSYREHPVHECPYHKEPNVIDLLKNCSKAVTYHNEKKDIVKVEADWIAGKRADVPGGPYARRISKTPQSNAAIDDL